MSAPLEEGGSEPIKVFHLKCRSLPTFAANPLASPSHPIQALIKALAKCQRLKTTWKGHVFQALVVVKSKGQALQSAWKIQVDQAMVKIEAKCQMLESSRKIHVRP